MHCHSKYQRLSSFRRPVAVGNTPTQLLAYFGANTVSYTTLFTMHTFGAISIRCSHTEHRFCKLHSVRESSCFRRIFLNATSHRLPFSRRNTSIRVDASMFTITSPLNINPRHGKESHSFMQSIHYFRMG